MGARIEEIKEEFSYYMVDIEDINIINKLQHIAITFSITPQLLAAEWMAYSCTHDCALNIDSINAFSSSFHNKVIGDHKTEKRLSTPSFLNKSILSDYGDNSFSESKTESSILYSFSGINSTNKGHRRWKVSLTPQYFIKPYKFMFYKSADVAISLNRKIHYFDKLFCEHYNIEHLSHVSLPSQEHVHIVGMIVNESDKTHINSLQLLGSLETSCGLTISLDFSSFTNSYSLFSGQVVMLYGCNPTGNAFSVSQIYLPPLPQFLGVQRPLGGFNDKRGVGLAVACGPYSSDEGLDTLSLLLRHVIEHESGVDVLFLMGPFVDIKVKSLEYSYEEMFNRVIMLLKECLQSIKNERLEIVLIPSERDAFHVPVYPQPPFECANHSRIHFVSNPNSLTIDGQFLVSSCSLDSLFMLSAGEISNTSGDRISRLLTHVLSQRSFQPVYPPPSVENYLFYSERIVPELFVHRPHVMLVASDLKYFIKNVDGCLCINPGRVIRGEKVGTFAYASLQEDDSVQSGIEVSCAQILSIS